jgi:hypothetical protein
VAVSGANGAKDKGKEGLKGGNSKDAKESAAKKASGGGKIVKNNKVAPA